MFLHREQSKRQQATLGIYLLQTTLPVIAALNQSQKRLQVWIEQGAGGNPRIPTLCMAAVSPAPVPGREESQVVPGGSSGRHSMVNTIQEEKQFYVQDPMASPFD